MSSMSMQTCIRANVTWPSFISQKPGLIKSFKASIPVKNKGFCSHSLTIIELRSRPNTRIQVLSASTTAEIFTQSSTSEVPEYSVPTQEPKVVKPVEKPRLALKFIWMEKNIGLALDQVIPGHGTVPLSPYFFWPRKDAWEELKTALESKPWISQKKMIILLNQATDIINLWQQSGGNLS
ncbi:30S ribosomal protein 3-1, chloroplastic [Actinidia eriantha]|uniref:30S ribosomal protein 3-1, chloroplastic n=1 Tax=Actinidia eriantha TaxID=165200 RepID=UPI002585E183|nr:30S ribosomal protein 3-1, chloroplastic [Actinidia eriantha]